MFNVVKAEWADMVSLFKGGENLTQRLGKSALLNQLIAAVKATHNPYFVIIDVNGSFRLHQQYFEEHGLDTH